MTGAVRDLVSRLEESVAGVVFGLADAVQAIAFARIARGHVLLEGAPGLGKTLLARTIASRLNGEFQRVQCTSDLMPSDIIGTSMLKSGTTEFEFRRGPIFCDVLLVDEINRTGPRTQSALLEAMEERAVSLDGVRYLLNDEFTVLATQNPVEYEGTYPLPESQIDRFLVRVPVAYPQPEDEARVLQTYADTRARTQPGADPIVTAEAMDEARAEVDATVVESALVSYVVELAAASRQDERVALGLSTRGARALLLLARIAASFDGNEFVRPDDVKRVAPLVVPHRLILTPEAQLDGGGASAVLDDLLAAVAVPR